MKKSLVWLLIVFGCLTFVNCDNGGSEDEMFDENGVVLHQYDVEYFVDGNAGNYIDVRFNNEYGNRETHKHCRLPYRYAFKTYDACALLSFSVKNGAQTHANIEVSIIIDGQVASEASASGEYARATADCSVDFAECNY